MSNSEELLAIRNESIKQQEQCLEIIENAIKEYSALYYNEYLNKMLENDASSHSMSNLTIALSDLNKITLCTRICVIIIIAIYYIIV